MAPEPDRDRHRRDGAARRPAGRDAARPRLPGDRAADDRGRARRRAPARPARDEGLTWPAASSTSTSTTRSPRPRRGSGPPRATRAAVVLPYGSRVATSRINFRLLARDAMTNGKRLSIVAGDAATRALAASAGLPVFATVGEYESSLEGGAGTGAVPRGTGPGQPRAAVRRGDAAAAVPRRAAARTNRCWSARPSPRLDAATWSSQADRTPSDAIDADGSGRGAIAGRGGAGRATAGRRGGVAPSSRSRRARWRPSRSSVERRERPARAPAAIPAARVVADTPATTEPSTASHGAADRRGRHAPPCRSAGRRSSSGWPCSRSRSSSVARPPSCSCRPRRPSITPARGDHRPGRLRIVASTTATEPDPARARSCRPSRSRSRSRPPTRFPATGKRIEEAKATGAVRFDNLDPTSSNTIPKGQHRQHGLRGPLPDRRGRHGAARRSWSG